MLKKIFSKVNISYSKEQFAKIQQLIQTNRYSVGRWVFQLKGNWIKFFYSDPGIIQDFLISAQFTKKKNEIAITGLYISENIKLTYGARKDQTIDKIAIDTIKECFKEILGGRGSEIKRQSTNLDKNFFRVNISYSIDQFLKIRQLIQTYRYLRGRWSFYLDGNWINFFYSDPGNIEDFLISAQFMKKKNEVVIIGLYVSENIKLTYGARKGQTIDKIAIDAIKECFNGMLGQQESDLNL